MACGANFEPVLFAMTNYKFVRFHSHGPKIRLSFELRGFKGIEISISARPEPVQCVCVCLFCYGRQIGYSISHARPCPLLHPLALDLGPKIPLPLLQNPMRVNYGVKSS